MNFRTNLHPDSSGVEAHYLDPLDPLDPLKAHGPPRPPKPPGPLTQCFSKRSKQAFFSKSFFFLLQPKDPLQSLEDYIEANSDIHFYLWVPFVLFMKYVMFQIPNAIWKNLEGGLMKSFYSNGEIKSVDNKRRKIKNAKG